MSQSQFLTFHSISKDLIFRAKNETFFVIFKTLCIYTLATTEICQTETLEKFKNNS